jgi:hypothetical protein
MAIKTYAEQLESVQAAIAKIESGAQAYEIAVDGSQRRLTRGDLKTLYEREARLRPLAARESRGRRGIGISTLVAR